MALHRKKSAKDIREQNYRIQTALNARNNYRPSFSDTKRITKVASITKRYVENIRKAVNKGAEKYYPLYNKDYERKMSQRVYMLGQSNG